MRCTDGPEPKRLALLGCSKVFAGSDVHSLQASPADGLALLRGGSVPGKIQQEPGGVARNIGECLVRLCKLDSLAR